MEKVLLTKLHFAAGAGVGYPRCGKLFYLSQLKRGGVAKAKGEGEK
jgi:hypothetical protein